MKLKLLKGHGSERRITAGGMFHMPPLFSCLHVDKEAADMQVN